MIGRAQIEKVAKSIAERDKVDDAEALRRAERWAAKKNGTAIVCTYVTSRDCECGSRRCVEIKKPFNERDPNVCLQPRLCGCETCMEPRRNAQKRYEGAKGGW